jgi:hypothetical protein
MQHPNMVALLQGLLTPLIGIIALYIAWQQWKGNQLKLKMERYERRLRVYEEVVKFLRACCNEKIEFVDILGFGASTAEGDFLFGPEIRQYLDEISSHAADYRVAKAEYRDFTQPAPPPDYDHNKVVREMTTQLKWFADQLVGFHAKNKFAPYLDISKI